MKDFLRPAFYLLEGLWLMIRHFRLLKLSLAPMLFIALLFVNILYVWINALNRAFYTFIQPYLNDPLIADLFRTLRGITGENIILVAFMGIFLPCSSLICLPLLERISRDTEVLLTGYEKSRTIKSLGYGVIISEMFLMMGLRLVMWTIFIALVFIPLLGQVLIIEFNCLVIAIDCLDMTMTRQHYTLQEKMIFFKENFWSFLLFASPILLIYYLPLLQILIIPAATIGGVLYLRESEST